MKVPLVRFCHKIIKKLCLEKMLFYLLFPLATLGAAVVSSQDPTSATTSPDTLHGDHYCNVHGQRQVPRNPVAKCVNIVLPIGVDPAANQQQTSKNNGDAQDDPDASLRNCTACQTCWNLCRQQRNMQELQACRERIETAMASQNATCAKAMKCFSDCRPKWVDSRPTVYVHNFS